jgi:DNA-binding MarR family transcriptional regulator
MFSGSMDRVLRSYPKIYLACHTRHVRDDESGKTLSPHLAGILDHLSGDSFLSISELARHLDVTESTISIQIGRLERSGYVRRTSDSQDRRRVRVRLTAAGMRVQEQNSVLDPDLVRRMISLLQPSEAEAAVHGLELLAEAAEELMRKRKLRRRRRTG